MKILFFEIKVSAGQKNLLIFFPGSEGMIGQLSFNSTLNFIWLFHHYLFFKIPIERALA
jgi:hypothetical protein